MELRVANTSTISTEVGSGIVCVKVVITRPLLFRTIHPRPVKFFSLKDASSKLTFTQPTSGGSHLEVIVALGGEKGNDNAL